MIETSPFITEGAIEFAIAILAVVVRLFSRWKLVGFRKWGGDDYFCILAAVLLTVSLIPLRRAQRLANHEAVAFDGSYFSGWEDTRHQHWMDP
jgi:hypothetical protein